MNSSEKLSNTKKNTLKGGSAKPQPQAGKKAHRDGMGWNKNGKIKFEDEKKGLPKASS